MYFSKGRGPQPFEPTPSVLALRQSTVASLAGRSILYSTGVICSSVCGNAETWRRSPSACASRPGRAAPVTRSPADVFVVGALHRFLVSVLFVHAGGVEPDIEAAFAVRVVLHRATAEEIEPVKPLVEQQPHAEPRQRDAWTGELHVVVHGDCAVAGDRIRGVVRCAEAVSCLGLDFCNDAHRVRAGLRRGEVERP